jgi:hypothetical protein
MATITISEQQYQTLLQRATRLNISPETLLDHLLERFLGHAFIPTKSSDAMETTPMIRTLGEVLKYGYGFWADRDDIEDPIQYATQLRQTAWQRFP